MKFKRRIAREAVLLSLYQIDLRSEEASYALSFSIEILSIEDKDVIKFAQELLLSIVEKVNKIDETLSSLSKKWKLHRMSYVDRNILRIAVYEILYEDEIPYKVAINEAVELAKLYGDNKSPKFVNGVLATLVEERNIVE